MLFIGQYGFGIFFTKRDLDETNKHIAIGFRIAGERWFTDYYFYPKPNIHRTRW